MLTVLIKRLTIVLGLLVIMATAWSAPMSWTFGGYLQARFTDELGTETPSTFQDMRPSLLIRAFSEDQKVLGQMFLQAPTGYSPIEVQHAFAEYRTEPNFFRLGLMPIPFGYENPVSSSQLVTTERSKVSKALIEVAPTQLTGNITSPGTYILDRGFEYYYAKLDPKTKLIEGPNVSIAIVNGNPYTVTSDKNDTKNIVARIGYRRDGLKGGFVPVSSFDVGASIYQGKNANGGTMNRYDVDTQATIPIGGNQLRLIGEGIVGKGNTTTAVGTKATGFYITGAYRVKSFEPYARFDIFDPSTDAVGDNYHRTTGGVSYYFNPLSKVQAEYESIDDQTSSLDGRFTAQYQIIF